MPLPATVRVKLSSEAAGAISITPVVVQELAMRDFIEHILGVAGKDEARVIDLIQRGTLVAGASRFRWQGWEPDAGAVREILAAFPDADPGRAFVPANCIRAVLRGGQRAIELPREAAARKGMFQRASFWDALMQVAAAMPSVYAGYSYRERCDRFLRAFSHAETEEIRTAASRVHYSTLRDQIRAAAFTEAELLASRTNSNR